MALELIQVTLMFLKNADQIQYLQFSYQVYGQLKGYGNCTGHACWWIGLRCWQWHDDMVHIRDTFDIKANRLPDALGMRHGRKRGEPV